MSKIFFVKVSSISLRAFLLSPGFLKATALDESIQVAKIPPEAKARLLQVNIPAYSGASRRFDEISQLQNNAVKVLKQYRQAQIGYLNALYDRMLCTCQTVFNAGTPDQLINTR